MTSLPYKS